MPLSKTVLEVTSLKDPQKRVVRTSPEQHVLCESHSDTTPLAETQFPFLYLRDTFCTVRDVCIT